MLLLPALTSADVGQASAAFPRLPAGSRCKALLHHGTTSTHSPAPPRPVQLTVDSKALEKALEAAQAKATESEAKAREGEASLKAAQQEASTLKLQVWDSLWHRIELQRT
jgi:hypothetical protein